MYKTIQLRKQTLEMSSYTQISRFQVFRLFVAMSIYVAISLGSAIPLILMNTEEYKHPENFLGSAALKSPWSNPSLCCPSRDEDERLLYFSRIRCPGWMSFLPPLMALGVFLMYGFGTPVRAAIRQISILTNKILHMPKRKMSRAINEMTDTEGEYEIGGHSNDDRLSTVAEESDENETQATAHTRHDRTVQRRRAQGSPPPLT
jgi:hypothetical protein